MKKIFLNSYALFLGLGLILCACANELEKAKAPQIPVSLELRSFTGDTFAGDSLILHPSGSVYGVLRIELDKPLIEVSDEMLGKVALVSASDPDIKEGNPLKGEKVFSFSDGQIATAVWQHVHDLAAEKGWLVKSIEYTRYTSKMVNDGVAQITLYFTITVSSLDGKDVTNGELQLSYHQFVKGALIPDLTDQSEVFSVFPSVANNGLTSTATILGKGTIYHTTVDSKTGEKSVQEWPFTGSATASVTLTKDTCWVEKFGVELVSAPTPTAKDLSNGNNIGMETTMATWKFSDGQTGKGLLRWIYEKVAEASGTPHVVVENLRYNEAGTKVQKINENAAWVTMSFLVDYHSEDSKTSSSDKLEMLVTYVQAIPVPEEPEAPTYSWTLDFTNKKNTLTATFKVTSSTGESWNYDWYAARVGKYADLDVLYVKDCEVRNTKQYTEDTPSEEKTESFEQDGAKFVTHLVCETSTNKAEFLSNGGGLVGPEEVVLFRTTDLKFTAPTGETIEVKIHPETKFLENKFSTENGLVGVKKTLPNESTIYTYDRSYTLSANHYVSCTVVENGKEKSYSIDCLSGGLLWENVSTTHLYTIQ